MAAWLSGNGCVPIHNLMEDRRDSRDLARANLAVDPSSARRAGRWPAGHRRTVPRHARRGIGALASAARLEAAFARGNFERAAALLDEITTAETFSSFLTLDAYRVLN
ncbi:MAG: hypothetical protein R3E65_07830 [Steroidobacteraceae bacterium]